MKVAFPSQETFQWLIDLGGLGLMILSWLILRWLRYTILRRHISTNMARKSKDSSNWGDIVKETRDFENFVQKEKISIIV